MFLELLRFEALFQSKQRAFILFILLFFFFGFFMGGIGQAPVQVDFNSAYQINYTTTIYSLGSVFIIMFFAISGAIRDKKYQMESLIFSTPIQKRYFFWSRFLGVFIFSVLGFSLFLPGFLAGLSISDLDPSRVASFQIQNYIWPFFVIVIPNFFICTSLIFSVSILTKSNLATYVSAVCIYILYFLVAFYSNSPIIATSAAATPGSMVIAAITDPFAGATFFEHTQFWTPNDKNTLAFSLSGLYLWNRILWITLASSILLLSYYVFSFRKPSKKRIKNIKSKEKKIQPTSYFSVQGQSNLGSQWASFWSSLQIDMTGVFKSLPFIVIVLILTIASVLELYGRIFEGGAYGDSWYPFTNLLIEIVMELVPMLSLILIIFYSGELMWRARDKKIDSIIHTTPALNWTFFLSKFSTLIVLPFTLLATVIIVCIGFQLLNGHTSLEIEQYLALFYYQGAPLIVYAMVAIFIQSLINNKYLGMCITGIVLLFLGTPMSSNIGIEHPMLRLATMPIPIYSNMAGYSIQASAFNIYALYWISFGAVLSVLSFKFWRRNVSGSNRFIEAIHIKKWKHWEIGSLVLSISIFTFAGIFLYTQLHKNSTYTSSNERMNNAEKYERLFKKYDTIPRLYYSDIKTKVNLYSNEEKYEVTANYLLENKNDVPVYHLFLSERKILSEVTVDNATLLFKDSIFGTYLFEFNTPILPQQTAKLHYRFTKQSSPYKVDRVIVKNGSYIRHESFEPTLGYHSSRELSNSYERERRGLPKIEEELSGDAHLYSKKAQYGNINYQTIVSTDADQIALAPGNLIKKWTESNRNYFQYAYSEKQIPSLAYFSGNYDVKKEVHNGITLEYYYHSGHAMNHETINVSTQKTLDYCMLNFGNYPFNHLRIAEIPSYHPFGGAAHPGLINMVEDNLYLIDIRNTGTFDLVSKRTVHEVAHQWWGMILSPKNVEGASFIVEGFAKYTEGVVLENMYGKGALWGLNRASNERYFKGRTFALSKEPPVYLQDRESYLAYGKSALIMLSIRDLIGEESLNNVLQTLINKYSKNDNFKAHTLDFLNELYTVTPEKHHQLIDEWMKQIVKYDLSIGATTHKKLANGKYEITLEVKAKRWEELANGTQKEIPINEPITIGLFKEHPKYLNKDDTPIYLKTHQIQGESTILKIETATLPEIIAVDPFLTRTDPVFTDNIKIYKTD